MTIIKTTGLAALAATSLLLTACGASEKGEATAAAGQPMAAEEKIVDLAVGETVSTTPEVAAIASVEGSVPGTFAELLRLHRSGRVVTAAVRLKTDGINATWFPHLEGDDGETYSAAGLRLVDEVNGRQHFPLESPEGECLCTTGLESLDDDQTADAYAKFPAPPEGVEKVSLHVPGFPSFDAVPLAE